MKAKYNSICCKCNQKITKGEEISYLSNKYKIRGEEVCCDCVDFSNYKKEIVNFSAKNKNGVKND